MKILQEKRPLVAIATFLQTPISYFFSDCMGQFDWNNDELDRNWQELSQKQKATLAAFLSAIRE